MGRQSWLSIQSQWSQELRNQTVATENGRDEAKEIVRQVKELQQADSAWSSPVVLVRWRDQQWRFCIDYKRLHSVTCRMHCRGLTNLWTRSPVVSISPPLTCYPDTGRRRWMKMPLTKQLLSLNTVCGNGVPLVHTDIALQVSRAPHKGGETIGA